MKIVCILAVLSLCTCSYSVYMNAYPHLKTVQITPFENQTSEYALAQDIQNYLVKKYQDDGRLRITTLSPDAQIQGNILDYKETIFSYDISGSVLEYRVQMLLSITMTDMVRSETLYENKSMLMSENYSPNQQATQNSDNPETTQNNYDTDVPFRENSYDTLIYTGQQTYTTPLQAQQKIYEKVFDTLMRETLESW